MDVMNHLLAGAQFLPSPNFRPRPDPLDISLLVIHGISLPPGEFGGPYIADYFLNRLDYNAHPYFATKPGLQVSAHLVIYRDGRITQFVPFSEAAWHAGVSSFDGRERCNDFSIGIELEGTDVIPYTEAQYASLSAVTRALRAAYPLITRERIVGHSLIAPGRKTDPGEAFEWPRYLSSLT
jgi:AmpD protein